MSEVYQPQSKKGDLIQLIFSTKIRLSITAYSKKLAIIVTKINERLVIHLRSLL